MMRLNEFRFTFEDDYFVVTVTFVGGDLYAPVFRIYNKGIVYIDRYKDIYKVIDILGVVRTVDILIGVATLRRLPREWVLNVMRSEV